MMSLKEKERMLKQYRRLIESWADKAWQKNRGFTPHLDRDDYISRGHLSFLEACDKFDPGRGVKFITFATVKLRTGFKEYLQGREHHELIHFPRTAIEKGLTKPKVYIDSQTVGPFDDKGLSSPVRSWQNLERDRYRRRCL